jgi:hypothetical protein
VSGTATLAVVLLVFFAAGIAAGVVAVIALSVRRTRRPADRAPGPEPWSPPEPDQEPWSQPDPDSWSPPEPWPEPKPEQGWLVSEDDDGDGGWGRKD